MNDTASACQRVAEAIDAGKAQIQDFRGRSLHGAKSHATYLLERRGKQGLFEFEPEKRLRYKKTVTTTDELGMPSSEHPLRFDHPPQIADLVLYVNYLETLIHRTLEPQNRHDETVRHLTDLVSSLHHLKSDDELHHVERLIDALGELICRAAEWQEKLRAKSAASDVLPRQSKRKGLPPTA